MMENQKRSEKESIRPTDQVLHIRKYPSAEPCDLPYGKKDTPEYQCGQISTRSYQQRTARRYEDLETHSTGNLFETPHFPKSTKALIIFVLIGSFLALTSLFFYIYNGFNTAKI